MNRVALQQGTVIRYLGQEATVISDKGGETLLVNCEGDRQTWYWELDDIECKVVSFPVDNIKATKFMRIAHEFLDHDNTVFTVQDTDECTIPVVAYSDVIDLLDHIVKEYNKPDGIISYDIWLYKINKGKINY